MTFFYIVFLITLITVLTLSLKSENRFLFAFGFSYFLYGLGLILIKFKLKYFGISWVDVNFGGNDYFLFSIINIVLIIIITADNKISWQQNAYISESNIKKICIFFITIGLLALYNELKAYGFENFLFAKKVDRFAGLYNITPNLYFLSINYHLFLLSGLYGLISKAASIKVKTFLYFSMSVISLIGFIQGYRYYIAIMFILVLFKFMERRKNIITVIFFITGGLFLADFVRVINAYLISYEMLKHMGFLKFYSTVGIGIIPLEIKAISANVYLGFQMFSELKPDILGYLIKFIPFSERFYDFSSMNVFYGKIAEYLQAPPGAGTAFSFILENYTSYFAPMIFLVLIAVLSRLHSSPLLLIVWIYLSLNLVRNGLIVSISEFKMVMIFYVGITLGVVYLEKLKITAKLKEIFNQR